MNKPKEYILCAAIWYKDFPAPVHGVKNITQGIVLCGHRHANIIQQHVVLLHKSAVEMGHNEQGFLTNTNYFVDRKTAYRIALSAGQIIDNTTETLYSEDLY